MERQPREQEETDAEAEAEFREYLGRVYGIDNARDQDTYLAILEQVLLDGVIRKGLVRPESFPVAGHSIDDGPGEPSHR